MTAWLLLIGIPLLVGVGCGSLSRTFMNASWRDRWQQPEVVVHSLALQSGNHVADLGAGGGYFTFRLADAVGPTGKVYAVDIDKGNLEYIASQAAKRPSEAIVMSKRSWQSRMIHYYQHKGSI